MVFCQAAIDDSGNEPSQGMFVLAGFVATAEQWIQFSSAWEAALRTPPGAAYFKFSEAMRLRGEFDESKGWTHDLRDERLRALTQIIVDNVQARSHAAMHHAHFAKYLRASKARIRTLVTDHPYMMLASRTVVATIAAMMDRRLADPCAFYFDTQPGQDIILHAFWPNICNAMETTPLDLPPGVVVPKVLSPPRFESEREWLPLQAADLLAGTLRMSMMHDFYPAAVDAVRNIPGAGMILDEEEVRRLGSELSAMMASFEAEHPHIPLQAYDPKTAKRNRKNIRRGKRPRA